MEQRLAVAMMVLYVAGPAAAEPPATPNVLLVSIDGLRFDRTSMGGGPHPSTPNLARIARRGVLFTAAFSQSNESMYSHATMLTGRMPSEIARPEYLEFTIPDEALMVAEALQDIGYETGGFLAGGHVRGSLGFDQGFQTIEEASDFGSFFETTPMALRWINTRAEGSPWFAFVHGYDCHRPFAHRGVFWHPFDPEYEGIIDSLVNTRHETERIFAGVYYPSANLSRVWHTNGVSMLDPAWYAALASGAAEGLGEGTPLSALDLAHLKAHYDSGALVADTYVGLLIDQLERTGRWADTVVIITSDHGEDLQDHGFTNHRAVLYDSTTRVPLIIAGGALPDALRGLTIDAPVDALDLVPTIMGIAGTVPPAKARGRDLWRILQEGDLPASHGVLQQGVLGQTSLRTAQHRFTFHGLSLTDPSYLAVLRTAPLRAANFALYDLASDPGEQHNLIEERQDLATKLRATMVEQVSRLEPTGRRTELAPDVLQMLRDRGYW